MVAGERCRGLARSRKCRSPALSPGSAKFTQRVQNSATGASSGVSIGLAPASRTLRPRFGSEAHDKTPDEGGENPLLNLVRSPFTGSVNCNANRKHNGCTCDDTHQSSSQPKSHQWTQNPDYRSSSYTPKQVNSDDLKKCQSLLPAVAGIQKHSNESRDRGYRGESESQVQPPHHTPADVLSKALEHIFSRFIRRVGCMHRRLLRSR